MSIQTTFNNQAINSLPKIKLIIDNATDNFLRNQMICLTLRKCCNSSIAIDNMSDVELANFQEEIISTFKHYEYI